MQDILLALAIFVAFIAAMAALMYLAIYYFVPTLSVLGVVALGFIFLGILDMVKEIRR